MPASEARIAANRSNALKSTGPRTPEGKQASRANSSKHGLTGSGPVVPELEAAEVERRNASFVRELNPSGEVGQVLIRHAARMSVRMERCAHHATAIDAARVRRALADFAPTEGCPPEEADRLRDEVATVALFDPSKEATLARKYELAAERGFFRALKEFQAIEKQIQARELEAEQALADEVLASFSPGDLGDEDLDAEIERLEARALGKATLPDDSPGFAAIASRFDLPFAVGKPR